MVDNVFSDGWLRTNSSPPPPQPGITYDASANRVVALCYEILAKYFLYEAFFSLAFDMDQ
jgi:hypothetical protein